MTKGKTTFLEEIEKYTEYLKPDTDEKLQVIPTGSISLDYSTGVGGIPCGRFTEVYGPESSAKTTLALSTAKNVLNQGKKVLYIDAENGLDWDYIHAVVGEIAQDGENFFLIQPEKAEESFSIAEVGLRSGEFAMIVLDSIAVIASEREMKGELADANVAEISRIVSRFIKRNAYVMRKSNTAFIFINQVRDKIGSYVPTLESPGGHALRHICSLRIFLQASTSKDDRIEENDEIIGNYTRFTIKKNKVGRPLRSFSFPILFGKGIDRFRDYAVFGEVLGVIQRNGAYYSFGDTRLGQGLNNTVEFLKSNPETLDKIKTSIYNMMTLDKTEEITEESETGDE